MPRKAKTPDTQPLSLLDMIEQANAVPQTQSMGGASVQNATNAASNVESNATNNVDSNSTNNAAINALSNVATSATLGSTPSSSSSSTPISDVPFILNRVEDGNTVDMPVASSATSSISSTSAKATNKRTSKAKSKVELPPFVYPVDPTTCVVCGIDEAGRGPLMGDVVAACVILDHNRMIPGIDDSKHLSEKKRDALAPLIKEYAVAYGIGRASPAEIDELNILHATFLAMRRAYEMMQRNCDFALIDGNKIPPGLNISCQAVVKGDARVKEIGAASILAKTTRDADLYELDQQFPEYLFSKHKGYPTAAHMAVLENLPILPCYRYTYGPVRQLIEKRKLKVMADHTLAEI